MKPRPISCIDCGAVRITCSRGIRCNKCSSEAKYKVTREATKAKVEKFDYRDVEFAEPTDYGRQQLSFTHLGCGTRQTWTLTNLERRLLLDPNSAPCSKCGSTRRLKEAMAAYVAKYGRDYDITKWKQYNKKVRLLSDRNYRKHKDQINPLDLPRGMRTYHLDHKFPIFEGFKQGIEPEVIARVENLQMLKSTENISKGCRVL